MVLTITKIGKMAGCSIGTVSRVINNSGYVSPETRQAVLKAIQETGYIPRSTRSGARAGNRRQEQTATGLIEVIYYQYRPFEDILVDHGQIHVGPLRTQNEREMLPNIFGRSVGFYSQIIFVMVEEIRRLGYKALLQSTTDLGNRQFQADVNLPDKSGILLVGEENPNLDQFIEGCTHPLVLMDIVSDVQADSVAPDNLHGIRQAFNHLFGLGHRKIGYVMGEEEKAAFVERFTAYKLSMIEAGLTIREEWICRGPNQFGPTARQVQEILCKPDRPTAMMCCNDLAALGVMRAADQLGIAVPEELSIVGFDDAELAALVNPALTTVRVPTVEMGREAVQRLANQIRDGEVARKGGCIVRFKPELVVRKSTGKVPI